MSSEKTDNIERIITSLWDQAVNHAINTPNGSEYAAAKRVGIAEARAAIVRVIEEARIDELNRLDGHWDKIMMNPEEEDSIDFYLEYRIKQLAAGENGQ
jgi:hypothetical protein